MDDLGAIVVIALFYTAQLSIGYLAAALAVFVLLAGLNRRGRVRSLPLYRAGGALMWFFMLKSGVHATIAGVLLAFALPDAATRDAPSLSDRLEHVLHKPVAFAILPIFALANTGVVIGPGWARALVSSNSLGIVLGLAVGKPVGIVAATAAAVATGLCRLPSDLAWRHVLGAGLLGGIGFTMSIFITNLAFGDQAGVVTASKMAILLASLASGLAGFAWLKWHGAPLAADADRDTSA
jgi:NhaA family Na+:H+ antiporter